MNRLERFLKDRICIYGNKVVQDFLIKINDNTLGMLEDQSKLNNLIKNYKRMDDNSKFCEKCIEQDIISKWLMRKNYNVEKTLKKISQVMDFSSWYPGNPLIFNKNNPAKDIMLIGMDPGPAIQREINIAYELGRYPIDNHGKIKVPETEDPEIKKSIKNNKLWESLKYLFRDKDYDYFDYFKKNIYITDIAKCIFLINDKKNNKISVQGSVHRTCTRTYLLNEIMTIFPKLIIFQGSKAYNKAKSVLKGNLKIDDNFPEDCYKYLEDFGRYKNFPKIGWIYLNEIAGLIRFVKIFHTSMINQNMKIWDPERPYMKFYKILFKKEIFPYLF